MRATNAFRRAGSFFLLIAALGLSAAGPAAARRAGPRHGVPHSIRHFENARGILVHRRSRPSARAATNGLQVSFRALGLTFDLELEENDILTTGSRVTHIRDNGTVESKAPLILYRGRVAGEPGSWVRLTFRDGAMEGMIRTADEIYFLQPRRRFFAASRRGATLAYRLSDTDSQWQPGSCALKDPAVRDLLQAPAPANGSADYSALTAGLGRAAATFEEAELGLFADYEYFQAHGANSAADMQSLINQIDGIYRNDVGDG